MDVRFFATPLPLRYSKGEEQFDTSLFIFHPWKGETYAESQVGSATKPGAR